MNNTHNVAPHQSAEADEARKWRSLAREGRLDAIRVVAAWSDVCGFGAALEKAGWDLESLKEQGIFDVLSQTYQFLGRPLVAGVPPEPSERVLIINDGVARSLDISFLPLDPARVVFYVRDILMYHFMLEEVLFETMLST